METAMARHSITRTQPRPPEITPATGELLPQRGSELTFFGFRYTQTVVSASGGKARIAARSARFEDGKLTTETFDGDLDPASYERMMAATQRFFAAQTALWLRSLAMFLPGAAIRPHDPERRGKADDRG
jgi:hypothetical protein